MKLITEYTENVSYVTEARDEGGRHMIEGVFMQAEQKNRNGRVYPKSVMEQAVNRYVKEQVETGRAIGELDHPDGPQINLDKVSHRITELNWDGDNVMGKALILDTPMGQIVKGLLEGGVRVGVSSRGMGTLAQKNGVMVVNDDFILSTVDIVQDPSAPNAFVNGIMEGKEWIWDNGLFKVQEIEAYETEIKRTPAPQLAEAQQKIFKDFLSKF